MRHKLSLELSTADRKRLERLIADRNTPAKVVWRADIVLATADGLGTDGDPHFVPVGTLLVNFIF